MNKPVLKESDISAQTRLDENGNGYTLKGLCCPKCGSARSFSINVLAFGHVRDNGLFLSSGQNDRIGPASRISCDYHECDWSGLWRELKKLDTEVWPEFKEGDRVISFGSRQNSGWSCNFECSIYVAKQRRRDAVVTWRREGSPFAHSKNRDDAKNRCRAHQKELLEHEGVKLRIVEGIKRGTVILNSENATQHLLMGGD